MDQEIRLETERLIIRSPRLRDVDDYMEFCNSEFVLRYNAMTVKSRADVEEMFARNAASSEMLLMEHRETGKAIGVIFVGEDSLRWGVNSREVSYFLHEAFSRQGYMKEALGKVVDHLFDAEKMECVSARSFAPNRASRKLLESLGFHQDGLIPQCVKGYRDVVFDDALYSLLREERNSNKK